MIDHLTNESEEEELETLPPEEDDDVELDESLDEEAEDEEDSEVDTEEPVDHDAEERRAAALLLQKGYNVSRANQQAAAAPVEEDAEDEGPDPLMDPVGFKTWMLAKAKQEAMKDQTARLEPILRPSLSATIKAGVIEAAKDFGVELSPAAIAGIEAEMAAMPISALENAASNPAIFHKAAADYHKQFPPKVKKAPVGVAGAPGPTVGASAAGGSVGTQIPESLKGAYKQYLAAFREKDSKENRADFMAAQ